MMRVRDAVLFSLLLLSVAQIKPCAAQDAATVATEHGSVAGITDGQVTKFLGIPYAAPPVGNLRWRPPQIPAPWTGRLNAASFGARCPQSAVVGEFSAPSLAEDCLFLNVFVPVRRDPARRYAVMVWIPGGGFFAGGSNDYDPSSLVAAGDVIFVSINYRIGLLGYLAQTDLDREEPGAANYGLMDQRLALQWVQRNIAAFGGDPGNVTIFGESAGAISVYAHLTSRESDGLFHKAILQSGFTRYAPSPLASPRSVITPLAEAVRYGDRFAAAMGCTTDVPTCLRLLPVEAIVNGQMPFIAGLITGATDVPPDLHAAIEAGHVNRVPVINGTNHDEWRWPIARTELRIGRPLSEDQYGEALRNFFGDLASRIEAEYAPRSFGSPSQALAAAETDAYFSCGALRNNALMARHAPVYGYEFNARDTPMYMPAASFPYGAAHTQELQFLFPQFRGGSGVVRPLTPDQNALAVIMVRYWSNFAKNGDPNGEDLPSWPRINSTQEALQSFDVPRPSPLDAARFGVDHRCAFWNAVLP